MFLPAFMVIIRFSLLYRKNFINKIGGGQILMCMCTQLCICVYRYICIISEYFALLSKSLSQV